MAQLPKTTFGAPEQAEVTAMTERDIFLVAVDLPDSAARSAYLDATCADNPALRAKVESLLRSHTDAGSFLGTPLVTANDPEYAATRDFSHDGTAGSSAASEPDEALAFLSPPGRPDSLGRIGHYEVLQVLGRGAFGVVFRAFDDVLQRVVAVKVLSPQMAATSPARKRFLREARTSAQIRHENVVQVYEVGETPLPYLVMEFIPGETLQARLDRTGPVEPTEVVRIGRQIAEGLSAAHAVDFVHRDIKPGNILLEGSALKVKITDFGLARAADDASISQSGIIAGTPMFMAPEQAKGDSLDHRADLFSLGSVLYQMVAGRPPFRANSTMGVLRRVAEDNPRPIREIIPETPQWLCDIIAKLHAKNPDDRFQTARELVDVFAACEERLKSSTNAHGFPVVTRAPEQRAKRRKWVAAAAVVACAAAVGLTAYALTRPGDTAPATAGTAHAPSPLAPALVEPAPKAPPAPDLAIDRKAALYVMSLGNGVQVNGTSGWFGDVGELPKTPFALTGVGLRGNAKVTDDGLLLFQGCRNIRYLDLANTKVTDAGLAHFKDCAGLTHLDLFATNVTDAGLAHFKACRFTHLSLRSTQVTDATAAAFGHCTELTLLGLAHTKVTEAGLAHFHDCTKLKHLDLDELAVSDAAVASFAQCKDLEVLHLGGAQVTDAGAARFKGCKRLKTLFLRGTLVTAAGIDDLKAALPLCRIEWNGGVIDPNAAPPLSDTEIQRVATLPLAEQLEEVRKELKKRNPDFVEALKHEEENGTIIGLTFATTAVSDITPVRLFPGLRSLTCEAPVNQGKLADLSPLKGTKLTSLNVSGNAITDLSPLREVPLTNLVCRNLPPVNLSQLKGMNLTSLDCGVSGVTDLSPLKGMKLTRLLVDHSPITDLSPLEGMPLTFLHIGAADKVTDLTPLKGMKLTHLMCRETGVTDLSPLKGMPLKELACPFQPTRDAAVLRGITTLEIINHKPANEFWQELGSVGLPFTDDDVKRVAAMTAVEQVEEVRRELKKRNPGYDGSFTHTIENDVVVGLILPTRAVGDLSPIRGLTRLQKLEAEGAPEAPGILTDLSSLRGTSLSELWVRNNKISDLKPLKGMSLRKLAIENNPASDLSVLKELPLKALSLQGKQIADLKQLEGLKLESLSCIGCPVADLTPLQGMPLKDLMLHATAVSDLTPLKGMKLDRLNVHRTKVSDLTPLKGMPLAELVVRETEVSDLTPIQDLPLRLFLGDIKSDRDVQVLKNIKTLESINGKSAADFWKEVEKK